MMLGRMGYLQQAFQSGHAQVDVYNARILV